MNFQQYTVAFRVDGSNVVGLGHVSTCLAIADRLKQYPEINFYFMMKDFTEAINKIQQAGYRVRAIKASKNEEETAEEMLHILEEENTQLLITDLLEINFDFSSELRKREIKSVSIDTLGKIKLQSDIIINRTFMKERYNNYNSAGIPKLLFGPEYVVLNKQYFELDKLQRDVRKEVKNVLVCLGGGDEFNITTRVVKILDIIPRVQVTIILGAAFQGEKELEKALRQARNQFTVKKDVKNMSEYLLTTDLAICAGGLTLYELAITGTPALIVPMNDHQVENALAFERAGSVMNAGLHTTITDESIQQNITMLMNNTEKRQEMSRAGKKITDGRGAERIAKIIYSHLRK